MSSKTLLLFDVDGTLTVPRQQVKPEMMEMIAQARAAGFTVGIVGGSDLKKQEEQLGADLLARFDYVFSENGLLAFKQGQEIHRQNFVKFVGDDNLKPFLKKTLRLIADADIPVQRGTFIELRNGMLNISPIGRNCSQIERDDFEKFDHVHKIRAGIISELQACFPHYGLKYSIGGQISFDVFPIGWDKTYCLQFVDADFEDIHFFGDKTSEGGNDFEIYTHPRTIGHSVKTYEDTITILKQLLSECMNKPASLIEKYHPQEYVWEVNSWAEPEGGYMIWPCCRFLAEDATGCQERPAAAAPPTQASDEHGPQGARITA